MKATRTNYDEMWDKYFDSYQGWLYVADRICPSQERQKPEKNTILQEECDTTYYLSDPEDSSSDKFYPVDKDNYFLSNTQTESNSYSDESKNPEVIVNPIQDQEKENKGHVEATEENNSPVETTEVIINTIHDKKMECSSSFGAEEATKTEKIVRCRPFIKQPDDIIFECDTGLGFAFVTQNEESLIYTHPRTCVSKTLGTISIDTTCLKNPKIKVLFSCNICFKPRSGQGTSQLEFVLSRSCNNSAESPMGNWIYDLVDKNECISQTFRFNFCSCNSFPGFHNYFIRVIPVYIKNCSVLITNCHMDAFAQSK